MQEPALALQAIDMLDSEARSVLLAARDAVSGSTSVIRSESLPKALLFGCNVKKAHTL